MRLFQYVYIEEKKYWWKSETNHFKVHTNAENLSECYYYKYKVFLHYF